MSEATVLEHGERQARKRHRCFHCSRHIAPGERYGYQSVVNDGTVYGLKWHLDCDGMWIKVFNDGGYRSYDFPDGYPPLYEMLTEDGELETMCDAYRGHFPHAVTRMEHNQSDAEDRYQKRLRELKEATHD